MGVLEAHSKRFTQVASKWRKVVRIACTKFDQFELTFKMRELCVSRISIRAAMIINMLTVILRKHFKQGRYSLSKYHKQALRNI